MTVSTITLTLCLSSSWLARIPVVMSICSRLSDYLPRVSGASFEKNPLARTVLSTSDTRFRKQKDFHSKEMTLEYNMLIAHENTTNPPRSHARCGHRMRSSELAPPLVGGVFAGLRRWAAQGRVTHCRKGAARRRGSDGAMTGGHTGVGRGFMLAAVEVEGVDLRRAGRPRPRAPESVLVVVRDGDAARSESVGGLEVGHAWGVDEVESACRRARRVVESLHCRSW
ncbi:hypothetical protein DFP72DRAFT_858618 [Ephemerocybe angulata]|uniref:Uncharacterized protein n=1 Tax=Ephemerocybe angulata TaxID=980116 RepID=A0A8H6HCG2_9AGAR|nr:hypothetical protein DFP72DRAFT_858618 [Tulosesus angulatus]